MVIMLSFHFAVFTSTTDNPANHRSFFVVLGLRKSTMCHWYSQQLFLNKNIIFYPRIVGNEEVSPRTNNILIYDFENAPTFNNPEKKFKNFHFFLYCSKRVCIINLP